MAHSARCSPSGLTARAQRCGFGFGGGAPRPLLRAALPGLQRPTPTTAASALAATVAAPTAAAAAAAAAVATVAAASAAPAAAAAVAPPAVLSRVLPSLGALPPGYDFAVAAFAAVGAVVWVKLFKSAAARGLLDSNLCRKLVHLTAGPLFVLAWPFFSSLPAARFVAAAVPCVNAARLLLVGSGAVPDPALVKSTSRSGDRRELLGGPLYYVAVLTAVTLIFWRDSPASLIAVAMVCGGDGLADIVGRRWGRGNPLPWNGDKSWAGSTGFWVGGAAMAMGLIAVFQACGLLAQYHFAALAPIVWVVCLVCTLIESLPVAGALDDNLSVPLAAVGVSLLLLPLASAASGHYAAAAAAAGPAPAACAAAAGGAQPGAPLLAVAKAALAAVTG